VITPVRTKGITQFLLGAHRAIGRSVSSAGRSLLAKRPAIGKKLVRRNVINV
jgi:hypothetical protein